MTHTIAITMLRSVNPTDITRTREDIRILTFITKILTIITHPYTIKEISMSGGVYMSRRESGTNQGTSHSRDSLTSLLMISTRVK
jgi:hypothetical protein